MLLSNLCDYAVGREPNITELPQLPKEFLKSMIEIQDHIPEPSRLSEDSEYVHVSSLLDLCPRQYWIACKHKVRLQSSPYSADRIVWEIGKALERHVVKNLKNYHGDKFVRSNENILNYEYGISGSPDVEIDIDNNMVVIGEVKTMNKRDFDKLKKPITEHILQVAMYRWLYNKHNIEYNFNMRAHDAVVLLYICKDYARESPYKEFHVDVNTPIIQSGVDRALELAWELKEARELDSIPERWVCDRQDCTRSKNCPVSYLCWSL